MLTVGATTTEGYSNELIEVVFGYKTVYTTPQLGMLEIKAGTAIVSRDAGDCIRY